MTIGDFYFSLFYLFFLIFIMTTFNLHIFNKMDWMQLTFYSLTILSR